MKQYRGLILLFSLPIFLFLIHTPGAWAAEQPVQADQPHLEKIEGHDTEADGQHDAPMEHYVHVAAHTALQIGVLLLLAMIAKRLCEAIDQPSVIGFILVGIFITNVFPIVPGLNFFFDRDPNTNLVVSEALWALAQLGAIILLFLIGCEVDFDKVMKVGMKATGIAIGGIILPFVGAALAMYYLYDKSMIVALFMGAVFTATSVGISAKVYSELGMLDSEEGLAVLIAGIVDDVGGLLVLSGVAAIAAATMGGGDAGSASIFMTVMIIGVKALVFLGLIVGLGKTFAPKISDAIIKALGKQTAVVAVTSICFIIAAIAEAEFQLAMIVGAAATGMVFSGTKIGHRLEEFLSHPEQLLAPIFFVVMGMLVDLSSISNIGIVIMALVMSVIAIIGKVVGCGLPAKWSGFSQMESFRIGVGMNNRGEVGLIVAGIGFAKGVFDSAMLAVAIIVILVTTIPTPSLLKKLSSAAKLDTKKNILFDNLSGSLRDVWIEQFSKISHARGFQAMDMTEVGETYGFINEKTNARIAIYKNDQGLTIDSENADTIVKDIMNETQKSVMNSIKIS